MIGGSINLAQGVDQPPVVAPTDAPKSLKDTVIYSWNSLNFERKAKDYRWYLVVVFIIIVSIGLLVWQKDYFTIGILVVVSAVLFWYIRSQEPKTVTYIITPLGITAGTQLYPFSDIHSFWIVYNKNVNSLYLAFTKKYLPSLVINLGTADPVTIKNILIKRIPEQAKRTENIVDKIVRIVGV
jgi:hypothetical protein